MLKKYLLLISAICLAACSSPQNTGSAHSYDTKKIEQSKSSVELKTNSPNQRQQHFSNSPKAQSLAKVYNQWAGTRYRLGGTSKKGIDCSGFMQATFATAFGIKLPRSTSEQRHIGRKIQKHELKQGDLVFFRKNNHVGVYIGNNQFMHASTKQGVVISSLSDSYWARTYTQSRRIL